MAKFFLVVCLGALSLSTVSCGSKYACRDTLGGVKCETPTEVYQQLMEGNLKNQVLARGAPKADKDLPEKQRTGAQGVEGSGIASQMEFKEDRKPVRVQPRVVRLWLAPWEDSDGDLHMGGFIYAEVAGKKRWVLGEKTLDMESRTGPKLMSPLLPGKNEDVSETSDSKTKGKNKGDGSQKPDTPGERQPGDSGKTRKSAAPLSDRGH